MKLDRSIYRLAKGDKSAFDDIYEDTNKAVYYTALSVVKDKHLAQDVMQSTYLSVIKNAQSYQVGTNARAWIIKIAKNTALNALKGQQREMSVNESENIDMFGSYSIDTDGDYVTSLAQKNLNQDEFDILMMVAVSGYKRREIAQILNMPIATVTWKYKEAIKKMRNVINKNGI